MNQPDGPLWSGSCLHAALPSMLCSLLSPVRPYAVPWQVGCLMLLCCIFLLALNDAAANPSSLPSTPPLAPRFNFHRFLFGDRLYLGQPPQWPVFSLKTLQRSVPWSVSSQSLPHRLSPVPSRCKNGVRGCHSDSVYWMTLLKLYYFKSSNL